MHQMLAAFFAMIFSFGHAQTVRHSELALASDNHPFIQAPLPTRQEMAHEQFQTITSYAETACVSCRRMNVASNAR